MDHLPAPINHGGHERVNFYAPLSKHDVWHPQDFFTLPREYEYDDIHDLVEYGLKQTMKERDACEFLMSWLWFALLAQVLNTEVRRDDFYRSEGHTLHTNALNRYLSEWIEREREDSKHPERQHDRRGRYARASIAIDIARRFISEHYSCRSLDLDDGSRLPDRSGSPISASTLEKPLDEKLTLCSPSWVKPCSFNARIFLAARMIVPNFMKDQTFRKETGAKVLTAGRGYRKVHGVLSRSIECVASRVFREALHMGACKGDSCRTVPIDEAQLVEWIGQGKTPLITLNDAGKLIFSDHDLSQDKDKLVSFVALTHGWADGIVDSGRDARNKNDRSMHRCQLEKFQETCNRLLKDKKPRTVYLWIDVLCVPREAAVKGIAINQMKNIYSKAKTVLVLDRALMQTRKSGSPIEINMRIRMSSWAQRLWTLQEVVLAEDLHIQFEGADTVSLKELEEAKDKARSNIDDPYHHVWRAGHPFSKSVWKLRQPQEAYRVQRAWEAVQFRLVTEREDETLVLANALRLDVKELEEIGEPFESPEKIAEKRMVKFLDMLDKEPSLGIPSGIIFLPPPKLQMEGYSWAPATWLTQQVHSYPLMRPLRQAGSMMTEGFLVDFPGLILHCPQVPLESETFWIPVHQSLHKWYKVEAEGFGRDFKDFWETQVCKDNEPAIIMSTFNSRERWEIGILVETKGLLTKGEIRWVRVLCRVRLRQETNPNIIRKQGDLFRAKEEKMMFGERWKSQKWCVAGE